MAIADPDPIANKRSPIAIADQKIADRSCFFFAISGQIRDLINQYLIEANSGQYDYVKALAEFSSKDESALTFKKGEIIAVVPKHDAYTEKVRTRCLSKFLSTKFVVYKWRFSCVPYLGNMEHMKDSWLSSRLFV